MERVLSEGGQVWKECGVKGDWYGKGDELRQYSYGNRME
jgi:hypothetical protein